MRIQVQRSGGFAGVTVKASVDTTDLPPDAASEIEALVEKLDLGSLAELRSDAGRRGADQFQYDIVVEGAKGRHTISLREADMPPELRQLATRALKQSHGDKR